MSTEAIRVFVAEDENMVRGALVALLSLERDIEVVAETDRGDRVIEHVVEYMPDVALLDINMPGLDGLTVARLIREQVPECKTIVLTGLSQPGYLLEALESHVRGFLLKAAPSDQLADAIRRVHAGQRVVDPDLVANALETGSSPLTAREAEVLRKAREGATTDQIAEQLYLSPATVRNYMSSAISKVGGNNRNDTIRKAEAAGWI